MKYVIKTLVLLGLFICGIIILEQHHLESFVNTYTASEVKQVGNTFSNNTKTKYTYQTSKGDKYVIYLSKKGKAYIVRTSKSGKQYKQYLPEVTKKLGNDSHQTVIYLPQTQKQLNTSSAQKQHYNPATPKNSCSV